MIQRMGAFLALSRRRYRRWRGKYPVDAGQQTFAIGGEDGISSPGPANLTRVEGRSGSRIRDSAHQGNKGTPEEIPCAGKGVSGVNRPAVPLLHLGISCTRPPLDLYPGGSVPDSGLTPPGGVLPPSNCEVNCETDRAYGNRPDTKRGEPFFRFPQLFLTTYNSCL